MVEGRDLGAGTRILENLAAPRGIDNADAPGPQLRSATGPKQILISPFQEIGLSGTMLTSPLLLERSSAVELEMWAETECQQDARDF